MSDRVYCYPGSNVLTNKLNIRDLKRLNEAERKCFVKCSLLRDRRMKYLGN